MKVTALVLATVVSAFVLTACSPGPEKSSKTTAVTTQQGVPGGSVVETQVITATVKSIDAANRSVTLVGPDGETTMVTATPEVRNFDQIEVGDLLKVTVVEELVVALADKDSPSGVGAATMVSLAPKGAKPGALMARTVQVTATVMAIDLEHHQATLQFPGGTTKTVDVRKDVDLTQRNVGEEVVISITQAMAIVMEKP